VGKKVGESLTTTKFNWPWESQLPMPVTDTGTDTNTEADTDTDADLLYNLVSNENSNPKGIVCAFASNIHLLWACKMFGSSKCKLFPFQVKFSVFTSGIQFTHRAKWVLFALWALRGFSLKSKTQNKF